MSFAVGLYSEIEVLQATGTANVYLQGSLDNNRIIGNAGSNIIDGSYGKDTHRSRVYPRSGIFVPKSAIADLGA